jgi:lambda family phage tail tape measure protein
VATETRVIRVIADTRGSKELQDLASSMGLLNKNVKSLSGGFSLLRNATLSYFSALGIGQIVSLVDSLESLQNRLAIVTGSQQIARDTLGQLADSAKESRTSVDALANSFVRIANSNKAFKNNISGTIRLTELLQKSFAVSGSTIAESSNTIVQLSQAFSSGEVRGQELRSVLEQNAFLAGKLRDRFGGDIYKKAEKGLISIRDVIEVIIGSQRELDKATRELAPTISQTLTSAFDKAKLSLLDFTKNADLLRNFAKVVDFVVENFGTLAIAISGIALVQLPALLKSFSSLSSVSLLLAGNPIALFFVGLAGAIALATSELGGLDKDLGIIERVVVFLGGLTTALVDSNKAINKFLGISQRDLTPLEMLDNKLQDIAGSLQRARESLAKPLTPEQVIAEREKALRKLADDLAAKAKGNVDTVRDLLSRLNKEFLDGKIGVKQYFEQFDNFELERSNILFREGRIEVERRNEALNLANTRTLNRQFRDQAISLQEFNEATEKNQLANLNDELEKGKISLIQYNQELVKIQQKFDPNSALAAGTANFLQSIGTVSENVAGAITQTFTRLEDSLTEFIKTGTFNFRQFTQAILDDLTRIIVRAAIIRPLAQGILDFSLPASTAGTTNAGSVSGGFTATPNAFASGGIVNSPTNFEYGRGKLGLMGEAGPEAILPLQRSRSGDLGVQASVTPVTVNVINQAGNEVTTQERTGTDGARILDILIQNKVKEGISSGSFDKTFQQSFGLRRRGS